MEFNQVNNNSGVVRNSVRRGNVEHRFNEDGTLDEVVLYDTDGRCIFHLEQMSTGCWWMGVGRTDDPGYTHVNLWGRALNKAETDPDENDETEITAVCEFQILTPEEEVKFQEAINAKMKEFYFDELDQE
jgi:hypothetical protein